MGYVRPGWGIWVFGAPGGICEAWFRDLGGVYGCLEPQGGICEAWFRDLGGVYGCLEPRVGYVRLGLETWVGYMGVWSPG